MKRLNNLFNQVCTIENLKLADENARQGKMNQVGIRKHDRNRENNILALQQMLLNKTYKTSQYSTFKIWEPKERIISRLPYFPDRILHHAIMVIMEPIFVANFTADTYSCIKGRGIIKASINLRKYLKDVSGTKYCLKLDVKKFYPNIDHEVLKHQLRRKIKDADMLWILDEIIDSSPGLPIGNYLSQFFANFYLSHFDHYIKQVLSVRYYLRYLDDIVILCGSKNELHRILNEISNFFRTKLNIDIKDNYQVFPVKPRGIDFVGYRHYHTHVLLRKSIKKNFARAVKRGAGRSSIASYKGWAKHSNSKHLLKKLLPHEQI